MVPRLKKECDITLISISSDERNVIMNCLSHLDLLTTAVRSVYSCTCVNFAGSVPAISNCVPLHLRKLCRYCPGHFHFCNSSSDNPTTLRTLYLVLPVDHTSHSILLSSTAILPAMPSAVFSFNSPSVDPEEHCSGHLRLRKL